MILTLKLVQEQWHEEDVYPNTSCTPCDSRLVFAIAIVIVDVGCANRGEEKPRDELHARAEK